MENALFLYFEYRSRRIQVYIARMLKWQRHQNFLPGDSNMSFFALTPSHLPSPLKAR